MHLSGRPRLRSYHMRPDGEKMAWVSRRTHLSIPPDPHQPSCHLTLGFQTGCSIFGCSTPHLLNYATLDAFRHRCWLLNHAGNIGVMMRLWITAASALPYTNRVGQSMVDTLLQMAHDNGLRPYIPALAWDWLKKRPVLRPGRGLRWGTHAIVVQTVQKFGDVGLITSYLFVVWSGRSYSLPEGCRAMFNLIREELGGIGAVGHRADLIHQLDYVLSRLGPGSHKQQYEGFRAVLLEVDGEATGTLTGMSQSHHPFVC